MRLIEALINKYFYVNIQGVDKIRVNANLTQSNTTKLKAMGSITTTEVN